jgi:hypothetical protein
MLCSLCRLTDQALSCRPPVKVPRPDRRAPAESTPNRAAAGWTPRQADPAAAGQLQCLVGLRPPGPSLQIITACVMFRA